MKLLKGYQMHNILKRIKLLEDEQRDVVINVYVFQPKEKTVYRTHGSKNIYMNYDEILDMDFTVAETVVAMPNYDNPNWEKELDGIWHVCVGGHEVINENS